MQRKYMSYLANASAPMHLSLASRCVYVSPTCCFLDKCWSLSHPVFVDLIVWSRIAACENDCWTHAVRGGGQSVLSHLAHPFCPPGLYLLCALIRGNNFSPLGRMMDWLPILSVWVPGLDQDKEITEPFFKIFAVLPLWPISGLLSG